MIENAKAPTPKSRWRMPSLPAKLRHPHLVDSVNGLALALFFFWLYSPLSVQGFGLYDLGIVAYGGARVSDGFIPYVDMHIPYGPAQYYIRALLFDLFGTSIRVVGWEVVTTSAILPAMSYWALRSCTARLPAALIAFIIGTLALALALPVYSGMLFAAGCMARYARREHLGWLVSAGGAIGFVGAERWDFGLYCGFVFASALVSLPFIQRVVAPSDYAPGCPRVHARRFAALLAPAIVVAFPFYAPALLTDPQAILRSLELVQSVRPYRTLPWPTFPNPAGIVYGTAKFQQYFDQAKDALPAYALCLLVPANVVAAVVALRARLPAKPDVALLLYTQLTTLLGVCLLFYAASRPDLAHVLPSTAFALLSLPLIFWLVVQLRAAAFVHASVLRWGLATLTLLIFLTVVPASASNVRSIVESWAASPLPEPFTTLTLAGMTADPEDARNYDALVDYIKLNTAPEEFIFSGVTRHDRLLTNDVLIYFASERHAGARDYQMDPGSTTRRDVQQQIISDLQRNNVRLVVLTDSRPSREPNKSQESSGVTDLDDYIRANYTVREKFGKYFVLTARQPADSPCASVPASEAYGSLEQTSDLTKGNSAARRDRQIQVTGWAATPAGSPPLDRVEVKVNGQAVKSTVQCIPREDLVGRFGESARYSGWEATIDTRDINGSDPADIEAEAVDVDGGRHPIPASKR